MPYKIEPHHAAPSGTKQYHSPPRRTSPKATQVLVPNPTLGDQAERDHAMPELTGTHLTVPSPKSYKLMSIPDQTSPRHSGTRHALPQVLQAFVPTVPHQS
jgi:hypothetical protein